MNRLSVLCFLLLPFYLSCQESIQRAEVVLYDGAVRSGFIDTEAFEPASRQFIFKTSIDSGAVFVGVDSVAELIIGEEPEVIRYQGYRGTILPFSSERGALPKAEDLPLTPIMDTVLLRVIVLGTASLLSYESADGDEHYFLQKGNQLEELESFRYISASANQRVVRNDRFRTQLEAFLGDCTGLKEWISVVKPNEAGLRPLLITYNECDDSKSLSYVNVYPKRQMALSAVAGAAFTRVSRNEDQIIGLSSGKISPRIGLAFKLKGINNPELHAWLAELLYSPFRTEDMEGEIDLEVTYLQLNIAHQWSWQSGASWPNVIGGLQYGYQLDNQRERGLPARVIEQHMIGVIAGFGVQKGRFNMGLRYEINNFGLFFPQAPNYYANSLSLIAGFDLFR
jgi:uncharacterized protein YceK